MDRRRMMAQSLGLMGATAFGATGFGALPAFATNKFELGTSTIDVVSDGNLMLPLDFLYPDAPADQLNALLTANGLPTDVSKPDCNLTLLRDGDQTVLFDVGSGPFFMPSAGKLADSLDALGVGADEITHVVFTHAHPDHLWGVLDDFDEPVFSNAKFMISAPEFDFWMSPGAIDTLPDARKPFAIGAEARLSALEEIIERFEPDTEVLPGIFAVNTAGHTPGHCSFEVRRGSESALVVGDAIAHHLISFEHGDWPAGSDQDAEMGIKTRMMLLDRLASEKMQIIGYHLPYPGTGYVEKNNGAYRFVAA